MVVTTREVFSPSSKGLMMRCGRCNSPSCEFVTAMTQRAVSPMLTEVTASPGCNSTSVNSSTAAVSAGSDELKVRTTEPFTEDWVWNWALFAAQSSVIRTPSCSCGVSVREASARACLDTRSTRRSGENGTSVSRNGGTG